jgi:hypothetical protein
MSIRRKIIESIKFVMPDDTAVKNRESYEAYTDAGYDVEKLDLEGKPAVFVLAPLTRRHKIHRDNATNDRMRQEATVQLGLRAISGYEIEDASGNVTELAIGDDDRRDLGEAGKMLNDKWMDRANLRDMEVEILAAVIERITELEAPL